MKTLSGIYYATVLLKLTYNGGNLYKWEVISNQYKNQVNGEFFAYLWIILLYFSLESRLVPVVLELSRQVVLKINYVKNLTAVTYRETGVWEYSPSSLQLW